MIINRMFNIIYQIKCIECNEISDKYLCKRCKARMNFKLELHKQKNEYKKYESKNFESKYFVNHLYLFQYKDLIREKIIQYKFNEKGYIYRFFAEEILEINNKTNFLEEYDYIIPVPISKKRMLERGYNQSELIAKELCRNIKSLQMIKLINKKKDNAVQSTLTAEERKDNVKDVYEINELQFNKLRFTENNEIKNNLEIKKFLIFDDIYTTGNTVNEVAKVLKNNGIKNIDVFTIAKD